MRIEILATARKQGVADEDIEHALRNAVFDYPDQGDRTGSQRRHHVGIGYLATADGQLIVVHAMRARPKYLDGG